MRISKLNRSRVSINLNLQQTDQMSVVSAKVYEQDLVPEVRVSNVRFFIRQFVGEQKMTNVIDFT